MKCPKCNSEMDHRINFGASHWQCSCGHNQPVGVFDWMMEDAKLIYYHTTGGWSTMPQRVLPPKESSGRS